MTICENCKAEIMDNKNDNYNNDHTMINCPDCGQWQLTN